MKTEAEALLRKEITFDRFAQCTAREWDKLAIKLWRRWESKVPAGVTVDDVRQEMLAHAWVAVGRFDPGRGIAVEKFVVWNAWTKARRFLHEQRSALRRDDFAESRHALSFSGLATRQGDDGSFDEWIDSMASMRGYAESDELSFEEAIDMRGRLAEAIDEVDDLDACALMALFQARGDVRKAGEMLFDERKLARAARWNSPSAASDRVALAVSAALG